MDWCQCLLRVGARCDELQLDVAELWLGFRVQGSGFGVC